MPPRQIDTFMKQPKTLKEIKAERRAIIEDAWFNQEITDDQLEAEYKALGIKLPSQNYVSTEL